MLSRVQKLLQGLVILAIKPARITEAFSSTDACCMHLSREPLQSRAKSGEATQEGKLQAALHGCTLLDPAHARYAQAKTQLKRSSNVRMTHQKLNRDLLVSFSSQGSLQVI